MSQWMTFLGGVHSGKTDLAHEICRDVENVVWWGTASEVAQDADWQQRLAHLRARRKPSWQTMDGPWAWPPAPGSDADGRAKNCPLFVFDSLNLWLAAHIHKSISLYSLPQLKTHLEMEFTQLMDSLKALRCPVLIISAEVGWGVVPSGETGRVFRDLLSAWNRTFVAHSHHGVTVQAGRAFAWPGGLSALPAEGAPVRCLDARALARLLALV
ncbi:hypothetical protein EBU99_08010 [bacterium]|nr:hypothetical protein [bacterium]